MNSGKDNLKSVVDHLINIGAKAMRDMQEDLIKDIDGSMLNDKYILLMIETISKCELWMDILLTQTEELGGFGSSYPKKCLENLKIFRTILNMELDRKQ